jgi:Ni/Fe-hydrogenase subunit HybB-like protein
LLFFISAMGAGLAMAIVESNLSARGFGHPLPRPALLGAARLAAGILSVYLIVRFGDLLRTGTLQTLRWDDRATWFFVLEIMIGFVLPIIYFSAPAVLNNHRSMYRAAQLCLLGFIINRLNVSVTGFEVVSGHTYVPAWTEVAVTLTILTVGVWAAYFAERFLPVLDAQPGESEHEWRWKGEPGAELAWRSV